MGLIPNIESSTVMHYFHPTFLYESLWNLVGFVIINALYKKKKFDGQVFFMYITWYGFGRMFIEGLRTDSLYVGVFRISQVVGFLCFVIGVAAIAYGIAKSRKLQLQGDDSYCGVYDKIVGIRETKAPYEWEKKSEKTVKENKKPEDTVEKENKSFNDYSTLLGDKKPDKEEKDDINKLS
jgi:phosphatidylglycerol:prolipoprotein diacylglycerol transferase